MRRIYSIVVVAFLLTSCAAGAHGAARPSAHTIETAAAHGPAKYILVLGDSASTGFHHVGYVVYFGSWHCEEPKLLPLGRLGWSCNFWKDLRTIKPSLKIENLAINGEDTCSFVAIKLCPRTGTDVVRSGKPPYDIAKTSQLTAALRFLRAHPNQVSPITFALGGNDGPTDIAGHMIPAIAMQVRRNRDRILTRIRAAAPHADILLMDYASPGPADLASNGFDTFLHTTIAAEARKFHALPVDVGSPTEYWNFSLTDSVNDHDSDTGQRVIGEVTWAAYEAYLHGRKPVTLTVRPASDQIHTGEIETFDFTTAPHASVSLTLTFTGGTFSAHGKANSAGAWQASWPSKGHRGKVYVHACATSGGASECIDPYAFVS